MTRARADRRGDDARRRRPRDHRERAQLDLVPALAASRGRGAAARRDRRRARAGVARPRARWKRSPTRIRWSTRRCGCIRRAGCCRAARSARTRCRATRVPAGTDVLLCPYLLHRHPRYWKEPDAFRPERFDAEHEAERPRFAYMPFAAGPRHCIGETFALYEMLMHLYKVARRYRLTLRAGPAARARGADQPAHPAPPVHEAGTPLMLDADAHSPS